MLRSQIFKLSALAALLLLSSGTGSFAGAPKEKETVSENGRKLYMKNCELCHLIGRNVINPEKEIQHSKLVDDQEKLKAFLAIKHGAMPAFVEITKNETELGELRKYLQFARKHPSDVKKAPASNTSAKSETKASIKSEIGESDRKDSSKSESSKSNSKTSPKTETSKSDSKSSAKSETGKSESKSSAKSDSKTEKK